MDNVNKYDVAAAVAHAISAEPLEFEKATQHILAAKIQDAIDNKRQEIATQIFPAPETEETPVPEADPEPTPEVDENPEETPPSEEE